MVSCVVRGETILDTTKLRKQLRVLRAARASTSPTRLCNFLKRVGFKFRKGKGDHIVGKHELWCDIIRIDMGRNPVLPGFADEKLDLAEQILDILEGRQ